MMLLVVGVIVLGLIGGGIYLATREKPSSGDSKEVVENKEKKVTELTNPTPLEPNPKNGQKKETRKETKKETKPKKEAAKKTPPKPPDPPPPLMVATDFKENKLFRGHDAVPRWLAVSPDGKTLLTTGDDKYVYTWSPTSDKGSLRFNLKSQAVGAAFLPNGKDVLVADGGMIYQIDLTTNKDVRNWTLPPNNGSFNSFAVSSDGKFMTTGMTIGKILWWDVLKNDFDISMDAADKDTRELAIDCLAIANDNKALLAGGRDGSISAWDGPTGKLLKKWKAHAGGVTAVAFSPDGKLVASAGVDGLARIWNRQNFAEAMVLKGHSGVVMGVSFLADSAIIVTCGIDKTIRAWDTATGLPLSWSVTAGDKVWSLALDPKDRFVIAGLGDNGVRLAFLPAVRPDYPPRSTWVQAPQNPQPAPLPFQIESATQTLRQKYKADFALTSADDQQALYDKLMGRAKIAPDDPPVRFALFLEARALAIRLGRMEDAFKAIDAGALWFEIDDLVEKAGALKEAGKGVISRPVVEAAAALLEQAEKLARIDIVDELLRQRELFPHLSDAPEINARTQMAEKRWRDAADDREASKRLVADWMKDPESAVMNLAYGKHLCFRMGQWSDGLPRLLKGEDAGLKEMAKKDQATPKDGKGQLELATAWKDYAAKTEESCKPGALLRANFWYDQASRSADLGAGEKNSAIARISEINRQVDAMPNAPANRGGVPVKRQQFNSIRTALALETQWTVAGTDGWSPEGVLFKGEGTLVSRFRVLDACHVDFAFVPDGREVTVQLNGLSASFKPAATTAIVFVSAERKGPKISFSLRSFTGTMLDEKNATLNPGKDDPSAITFKASGGSDKNLLVKSIVVHGMVRPVD